MNARERVLNRERQRGRAAAQEVQTKAPEMTGTELYAVDDRIPHFRSACARMNMLDRSPGFICLSPAGRVVKLIQPYDSDVFTQDPEDLPAQYGFVWSTDPAKARPFVAMSTSPYMTGDCCTENDRVFRSKSDHNVHAPSAWPDGWEEVV
jgi:hypothetical protein